MTGRPNHSTSSDVRIMRALILRAGLDEHSAARELEIDEMTMQGYVSGEPVPRCVVFALMRLADLGGTLHHH
jgi:hypothetical protein